MGAQSITERVYYPVTINSMLVYKYKTKTSLSNNNILLT